LTSCLGCTLEDKQRNIQAAGGLVLVFLFCH
jgi:hypothetical protein